jgi:F0F1-type ATP synthase delta subunit
MTQILNRDKEIYSTLLFTKELILNPGIPKKQKIELIDKILDSIKN